MRKLKIFEHISLDGVIQAPGGADDDGDYPDGGWTVPFRDPAGGGVTLAAHGKGFDLLLGLRHVHSSSPARKLWPQASFINAYKAAGHLKTG
jgi:hypothetical protein